MKKLIMVLVLTVVGNVWGKPEVRTSMMFSKAEVIEALRQYAGEREYVFDCLSENLSLEDSPLCYKRLFCEPKTSSMVLPKLSIPAKINALSYVSKELKQKAIKGYKKGRDIKETWAEHKWVVKKVEALNNNTDDWWFLRCSHCDRSVKLLDEQVIRGYSYPGGFLTKEQLKRLYSLGVITKRHYRNVLEAK